ncbi:MAG: hypothetical protein K2L51_03630 [Clostridiales bacterium]|nr:hypothetical protein [Clostridiales bacterium]
MKSVRKFLLALLLGCMTLCVVFMTACDANTMLSGIGGSGNGSEGDDGGTPTIQYAALTATVTCNEPSINFENAQIEFTPAGGGNKAIASVQDGAITIAQMPQGNYTAAACIFGLRWQANGGETIAVNSANVTANLSFETDLIGAEGRIYDLNVAQSSFSVHSERLDASLRATGPVTIPVGLVQGEFWLGAKIKFNERDLRYGNSLGIAFTADTVRYRVVVGHSEDADPDHQNRTARVGYGVAVRGGESGLKDVAVKNVYEIEKTTDMYSALIDNGAYIAVHRTGEGALEVWLGASTTDMQKIADIDHAAYVAYIMASGASDDIKNVVSELPPVGTQDITRLGFRANLITDLPTAVAGLRCAATMADALANA